ncbi:MAG: M48 family metallopeptidase [Pseudomonadota bacterium]|nr:M48 family metallopeptidase [Pseudomonadota bacterium]
MLFRARPSPETGHIELGDRDVPFTVIRNARRKRTIAFTIDDNMGLRILAPSRARLSVIKTMLRKRSRWIEHKIAERQQSQALAPKPLGAREAVSYLGHFYKLNVTQDLDRPHGCHLRPRQCFVNIPLEMLSASALRDEVRLEIQLWLKKRARTKFQKRMDLWSEILGVRYKKLMLSNPEQRWGSCSVDNVVRLNWRLIMAPLPLLDYVVAHELCHVLHKNHSMRFWRCLGRVMPDYRERRRQLRQMGNSLAL